MMRTFYLLAFVAIAVCSCNKRIDAPDGGSQLALTAVQSNYISSDSSLVTRATEGEFQNNDAIGLFIHTSAVVGGSGYHSSNLRYFKPSAKANWQATATLENPLRVGTSYKTTAYYPYKMGVGDATDVSHSVAVDQSATEGVEATGLEGSDFMISSVADIDVGGAGSTVALSFTHVMTKMAISVGIPKVVGHLLVSRLKSVRVMGLNSECNINLATGAVVPKAMSAKDIKPRLVRGTAQPGELSVWECIVVPQVVAEDTPLIEFICELEDGSQYPMIYTIPSANPITLRSGTKLALMLGASSNPSFLTSVAFNTGDAATDVAVNVKVLRGLSWSCTSSNDWLKIANKSSINGGVYGDKVTGLGTGMEQTIYIKVDDNSTPLSIAREGMLTLSDDDGFSITYLVFQNYTSFAPTLAGWSVSAGVEQSRSLGAFITNQSWEVGASADNVGLGISTTATGAAVALPHPMVSSLTADMLFVQTLKANNTAAAVTGKVFVEVPRSNPRRFAEMVVTQAAPIVALDKTAQSVASSATSATFRVTTPVNHKGVKYSVAAGSGATSVAPLGEVTVADAAAHNGVVTVNFPANTLSSARTIQARITYGGTKLLTHTITQAAATPPTVTIAGTKWLMTNLTGDSYGVSTGHKVESAPQGYGAFFKWGTFFIYQRASRTGDGGGWGADTSGAATTPSATSTGGTGYDYGAGLAGGANPGDPCQKLGTSYKTPTRAQWRALNNSGKSRWTTYQGVQGYFFGPKAAQCNNTTIQDGCIFLPASGRRDYSNGSQGGQGDGGYYWSSSVSSSIHGYICYFNSGGVGPDNSNVRGGGLSVRCVDMTLPPPATVEIAGAKWTLGNLTGTNYGVSTGHKVEAKPEGYGAFFKWGAFFIYQRDSRAGDGGGWGASATGAATTPSSSSSGDTGYDYVNLVGGTNPGDPCQKLGSSYKTPTRAQWQALNNSDKSAWTTYQGIAGCFFGPKASQCNNTTIQDGCIFIPASGYRSYDDGSQGGQDGGGYYWSSSVSNSDNGWFCSLYDGGVSPDGDIARGYGFSVRCIAD